MISDNLVVGRTGPEEKASTASHPFTGTTPVRSPELIEAKQHNNATTPLVSIINISALKIEAEA